MKLLFKISVLLGLFWFPILTANQWIKTYSIAPFIGPEIYYMKRVREGGSKQQGVLYGVRVGYDDIRRYKWYWGVDALWAQGTIEGHDSRHACIKSQFTDENIEARFGYTIQSKYWRCASLTPFIGVGYFCEKNFYKEPSPIPVHFKNNFSYVPIGFLSQLFLSPELSIGINFKIRVIFEGEQQTSHDPKNNKSIQHYDEKLQYRAELPITYFFCWNNHPLGISVVPFYEYRSYGHRADFPFNFLETNLKLYGATLKCLYLF